MLNVLVGVIIGVVGSSIAWFFIAKNNKDKLLKAFAKTNEVSTKLSSLPQEAKDYLKKFNITV